jgi:hypothetical protein
MERGEVMESMGLQKSDEKKEGISGKAVHGVQGMESMGIQNPVEEKEGVQGQEMRRKKDREEMRKKTVREEKLRRRWARWLDSEWYGSVVQYKLFGRDTSGGMRNLGAIVRRDHMTNGIRDAEGHCVIRMCGDGSRSIRKRIEKKATDFRLVDVKGSAPRLAYVERNGAQSWCILRLFRLVFINFPLPSGLSLAHLVSFNNVGRPRECVFWVFSDSSS